ncbi:hypothetical protein RIN60_13395 [Kluyvera cryocrescens]|uniref:hypothetical protein n=1 Tax=Kluyvera cryocrescens TaxID=580 RepID=UPI0028BD4984|nr:hypothetical protein [Kluyvera cryocrescens]WNN70086.1 hypothetical protein RIN60_13395 [Kluyvera cryocrescens]
MGKYFDDYEREADYQNWLYYRESSHEDRESQSRSICTNEEPHEVKPGLVIQPAEWPITEVFRDYPEHKALVELAENKYIEDKLNRIDLKKDIKE